MDKSATRPPAFYKAVDLHLEDAGDGVEEIVVYGIRPAHAEMPSAPRNVPISSGPATIAGGEFRDGSFAGSRATLSLPIFGMPDLETTLNLSGGHDQVNTATTAASAALTAGLRLRF